MKRRQTVSSLRRAASIVGDRLLHNKHLCYAMILVHAGKYANLTPALCKRLAMYETQPRLSTEGHVEVR